MLVCAQVRILLALAVTDAGATIFCVTLAVAVELQPLEGSVTVRIKSPGTVTVATAVLAVNPPGPLQLYPTPGVAELPVSTTFCWLQFNRAFAGTLLVLTAVGTVVFWLIRSALLAVQPLTGLVAVTE